MTARLKFITSFVLIMASAVVTSVASADAKPIYLGSAADGTRIMFESRLPNDYREAVKHIDNNSLNRPRNAHEYAARMKASCQKRFGGHGALGMFAHLGPELVDESLQEWVGDSIGFASAQVAAAPQDDPGWFIHWAESSFSWDSSTQIAIAVATQMTVSHNAISLMDDVCQYYALDSKNKKPIPLDGIEDGPGARQVSQMSSEEATIVKRIYKTVRLRRAAVNGVAMGIGMVLGQNFIEAKNDPNLRKCAAAFGKRRWGNVQDFADYNTACKTAARTWFSKTRAADLATSIVSSLLSGTGTYALREAGGAALQRSGLIDRSALIKFLSSPETRRLLALKKLAKDGGRAAWYTIRGLKFVGRTTGVNFGVEVLLEAGTSIVVYNVDQHIIRPILIPWAKQEAFKWEMNSDTNDLDSSLNRALSGNHDWMTTAYISGGGVVPTSTAIRVPVKPAESVLSEVLFKNAQWRDHILQDVNEIRSNWMDSVKYPDTIVHQGKIFYDAMIDLGGHETLYPTPLTWDFFTNPRSKFNVAFEAALKNLSANTATSKKQLEDLVYELDTTYNYITQLQAPEGRRELLQQKLVSESFLNRIAQPDVQAELAKDALKVQTAGLSLTAASQGTDVATNVRIGIQALVALVNDPDSTFSFPSMYRVGPGGTSAEYVRSVHGGLIGGSKTAEARGEANCGEVTRNGVRMNKKMDRRPAPVRRPGDALDFRCDNFERYAFVNGVYQNRVYVALKTYVGYPFKLQPKVEDVEQILNSLSNGDLFQPNTLTALTPAKPFEIGGDQVRDALMANRDNSAGYLIAQTAPASSIQLYSNLDLFVNKLLCGNELSSNFVGENDLPILPQIRDLGLRASSAALQAPTLSSNFRILGALGERFFGRIRGEGLRIKMGSPRIAVDFGGQRAPSICNMHLTTYSPARYVDYYAKDFMFKDRLNVAPLRTSLNEYAQDRVRQNVSPNGAVTPAYSASSTNDRDLNALANRYYTDYLDLALNRIDPKFLKDPSSFEKSWEDGIAKPYLDLTSSKGLQGRYETLMKKTMLQQGIVWRRTGDYNKCVYSTPGDFLNCTSDNVFDGSDLINPFSALAAFNQHPSAHPVAVRLNSSITTGLDQFMRTNLETPIGQIGAWSGRGLYVASTAELALYEKIIWKVAKNLQGRLNAKGVSSAAQIQDVKSMLRRLFRANQLTWQMIDELTPKHPQACSSAMPARCTTSRVAAFSIVEAVLPIIAHPTQRAYMKQLEVRDNARMLPQIPATDSRLTPNLSNRNDASIDVVMENYASDLGVTPENGLGKIRGEFPMLAYTFSRNDSYFRTAKTFAIMSVELDLLRVAGAMGRMIWAKKGSDYVLNGVDRLVFTSIAMEAIRAMRSNFQSIHGQVALFDAFKGGVETDKEINPKIDERFKSVEELAHRMENLASAELEAITETSCEHRLILDRIYRSRPDLNRSVSCAVTAGQLTLETAAIKNFEVNIR